MKDVTNKMQLMSVEDKCVYEPIQEHAHTETEGQRACMRCVIHSCVVRHTWIRTEVLALTEGRQPIKRLGVRLGCGWAVMSKARQSQNLSTLFGSVQKGAKS